MSRLSKTLLYSGAGACALGVAAITAGVWVNLPPAAVRAVAMALPFVVGGVLLVVGAVIGRSAHRRDDVRILGAGGAEPVSMRGREEVEVRPPSDRRA